MYGDVTDSAVINTLNKRGRNDHVDFEDLIKHVITLEERKAKILGLLLKHWQTTLCSCYVFAVGKLRIHYGGKKLDHSKFRFPSKEIEINNDCSHFHKLSVIGNYNGYSCWRDVTPRFQRLSCKT